MVVKKIPDCGLAHLQALERVRQAASKNYVKQQVRITEMRFTALLHHIYNPETLRIAYFSWKKEAAPGVDGETWRHYGEALEARANFLLDAIVCDCTANHGVRLCVSCYDGRCSRSI
jgi:hypothetical protein